MDTIEMLGGLPWYCYFLAIHFIVSVFLARVMYLRIKMYFPSNSTKSKNVLGDCENQEELLPDEMSDDAFILNEQ